MSALPALDLGAAAVMLAEVADRVLRAVRGEVPPFPRPVKVEAARAPSAERPAVGSMSGPIAQLQILALGTIEPERLLGARIHRAADVTEAAELLAEHPRVDAVVTSTEAEAVAMRSLTHRPVVVDGERLKTRIRLAIASWATQQLRPSRGDP